MTMLPRTGDMGHNWKTPGAWPMWNPGPMPHFERFFLACSGQGFSILRTGRARPEVGGLKTWPASAKQGTAERCLQSRVPPEIR